MLGVIAVRAAVRPAVYRVIEDARPLQRQPHFDLRDIYRLPLARALPVLQCHQDRHGHQVTRHEVQVAVPPAGRLVAGQAAHHGHP